MASPWDSRIAAKFGIRGEQAAALGDQAAEEIGNIVKRAIDRFLRLVTTTPQTYRWYADHVAAIMRRFQADAELATLRNLDYAAGWGYQSAVNAFLSALPGEAIAWISTMRASQSLAEATTSRKIIWRGTEYDLGHIFAPPSKAKVIRIIHRPVAFMGATLDWPGRLSRITKLASDPQRVAMKIASGIAGGKLPRQIRQELASEVRGNVATAERLVRTEVRRVAHDMSEEMFRQADDVIDAYQIHGTMDIVIRPHHAARNGVVYFKRPKAGQPSASSRPALPDEPNCRCWYSPVLTPPPSVLADPGLAAKFTAAGGPTQDPAIYEQWWATATERERHRVVGVRRYQAVAGIIGSGGTPQFSDFVDPATGELLPIDAIKGASLADTMARRAANASQFSQRKSMLDQLAKTSFLLPEKKRKKKPPPPPPPPPPPTVAPVPPPSKTPQMDAIKARIAEIDRLIEASEPEADRKALAAHGTLAEKIAAYKTADLFLEKMALLEKLYPYRPVDYHYGNFLDTLSPQERKAKPSVLSIKHQEWIAAQRERNARRKEKFSAALATKPRTGPAPEVAPFDGDAKTKWEERSRRNEIAVSNNPHIEIGHNNMTMVGSFYDATNVKFAQYGDQATIDYRKRVDKAIDWLRSVAKVDIIADIETQKSPFRANAHLSKRRIKLEVPDMYRTVIHEMGHLFETDKGVLNSAMEFRDRRFGRTGPPWMDNMGDKSLIDIRPLGGKDTEVSLGELPTKITNWDAYSRQYAAKVYPHATEIVSMGLEEMFVNPVQLAKDDPDYFRFIIAVIRGALCTQVKDQTP